jgi:hypothetical protein
MLKANVGLSRKISRDFQSTGYTVNLEGEIAATPDDSEGVLERVRELFNLAQESLNQEIDRDQGEQAIGRRDEEPPASSAPTPATKPNNGSDRPKEPPQDKDGKPSAPSEEGASNKQCQYILNLAKRQRLTKEALGAKIEQIVGFPVDLYQLSKRQAGLVINGLTGNGTAETKTGTGRS